MAVAEPDVAAALGGDAVGRPTQSRQRALAARRGRIRRIDVGRPATGGRRACPGCHSGGSTPADCMPVGELATDRHLDAEQVEPGRGQGGGLVERARRHRVRRASSRSTAAAPRRAGRAARAGRPGRRRCARPRCRPAARPRRPRPCGDPARAAAPPRGRGRPRRRRRRGRAAAGRGRTRSGPSRTAGRCRRRARPGRSASQRSTAAPASGRPDRSSPLTPNRRSSARSWPSVVEARARAPHAPASVSARSASRSIERSATDGLDEPDDRAGTPRNAVSGSSR